MGHRLGDLMFLGCIAAGVAVGLHLLMFGLLAEAALR